MRACMRLCERQPLAGAAAAAGGSADAHPCARSHARACGRVRVHTCIPHTCGRAGRLTEEVDVGAGADGVLGKELVQRKARGAPLVRSVAGAAGG